MPSPLRRTPRGRGLTVKRLIFRTEDLTVHLSSSDPTEVTVPASVVVLAGQTEAAFDLKIIDDLFIDGPQSVAVTAHVENWTDAIGTTTVLDDESLSLTITVPMTVWEGESSTGSVSVNGLPLADVIVSLTTDSPDDLTPPGSVTIPSGQQSADFTMVIPTDDECDGTKTASVTASVGGNQTSGSTQVLDANLLRGIRAAGSGHRRRQAGCCAIHCHLRPRHGRATGRPHALRD